MKAEEIDKIINNVLVSCDDCLYGRTQKTLTTDISSASEAELELAVGMAIKRNDMSAEVTALESDLHDKERTIFALAKEYNREIAERDRQIGELTDQLNDAISCMRLAGYTDAADLIIAKYKGAKDDQTRTN
jgi:hypothetical protein